ncbi:hypothetical protein M5E87_11615 [Flavonifractor plautii]|nr:hypothetical protein M5E87_11615 [Flavonifractor plautii]
MLPVRTGGYGLSGTHKSGICLSNVKLTDIPELSERADILCIGKEIVDAPLLDWKLDVMREEC